MVVRDIQLRTRLSKNIYLSRDFLSYSKVKVLGKVLMYKRLFFQFAQFISRQDGQSKGQTPTDMLLVDLV